MSLPRLTDEQLDVLREMSNIGMGHAATALSQMIGKTIYLKVPQATVVDFADTSAIFGGDKRLVASIHLQILGEARGDIVLVFPMESAITLIGELLPQQKVRGAVLTELELSSLKEVGNILASAFLNALGTMLKLSLIPSTPILSFDLAGAVVTNIIGTGEELSVMAETEFHCQEGQIKGHFFLLPDAGSLQKILELAGVAGPGPGGSHL
jgi:chemotaxis protein CheC